MHQIVSLKKLHSTIVITSCYTTRNFFCLIEMVTMKISLSNNVIGERLYEFINFLWLALISFLESPS